MSHELRRGELETFARHLGFHLPVVFPDGSIPDVALAHMDDRSLFLGDAKHTERPAARATRARLFGYLAWLNMRFGSRTHRFAIAYAPGIGQVWSEFLVELAYEAGLVSDRPWVRRLSVRTEVALLRVRHATVDPRSSRCA